MYQAMGEPCKSLNLVDKRYTTFDFPVTEILQHLWEIFDVGTLHTRLQRSLRDEVQSFFEVFDLTSVREKDGQPFPDSSLEAQSVLDA